MSTVADLLAESIERFGQPVRQDTVERSDQERAKDSAVYVADAAEDHGGQNEDGEGELELAGVDILKRR